MSRAQEQRSHAAAIFEKLLDAMEKETRRPLSVADFTDFDAAPWGADWYMFVKALVAFRRALAGEESG